MRSGSVGAHARAERRERYRSASGDASAALELLLTATGPRDIAKGEGPLVDSLRRDKEEVNAAYNEAKKAPPRFAGEAATRDAVTVAIEPFRQPSGGYVIGSAFRYLITTA